MVCACLSRVNHVLISAVTGRKQLLNSGSLKRLVDLSKNADEELCTGATGALWRAGRTGMVPTPFTKCLPLLQYSILCSLRIIMFSSLFAEENVRSLVKFECIPHFVALLGHRNDEIQTYAAGVLANMALTSM